MAELWVQTELGISSGCCRDDVFFFIPVLLGASSAPWRRARQAGKVPFVPRPAPGPVPRPENLLCASACVAERK